MRSRTRAAVVAALFALTSLVVIPHPASATGGGDGLGGGELGGGLGLGGGGFELDGDGELPDEGGTPADPLGPVPSTGLSITDVLDSDGGFSYKDGDRTLQMTLVGAGGEQGAAALATLPDASETNSTLGALEFATGTGQRLELGDGVVVLVVPGTTQTAVRALLARHGVSAADITAMALEDSYLVATGSDAASLKLAADLAGESLVVSASPNWVWDFEVGADSKSAATLRYWCAKYARQFSDELSPCAWHFDSSTNYRGMWYLNDPTVDINLSDAWQHTMGQGVGVAVVDARWNGSHEDLAPNADIAKSRTWGGSTETNGGHGTMVAGIVGARDNALGGRGVAPRAKLINYPFIDSQQTSNWAHSFTLNSSVVGVSNHSYTTGLRPSLSIAPYNVWQAMNTAVTSGFGGKGQVIVKAAGNEKRDRYGRPTPHSGRTSLHEFHSHVGVVAVCALDAYGDAAAYSNEGPNLWLCAPSSGTTGLKIVAPHGSNDYGTMGGTSSAAPQVSGVAALVRSVNPNLTWRDVKLLLADTATKNRPTDTSWQAGADRYSDSSKSYSYSPKFGFGVVNADDAVDKAFTWPLLPPEKIKTSSWANGGSVPNSVGTLERTLNLSTDIDFIEHVRLTLYMKTNDVRDFTITLVAPSGRESEILDHTGECDKPGISCGLNGTFEFATTRHLGEDPSGTWKLRIKNNTAKNIVIHRRDRNTGDPDLHIGDQPSGSLVTWRLTVSGHDSSKRVATPKLRMKVGATDAITASVSEGSSLPVTVTVDGSAPVSDLVVPVKVTAGTAQPGASKDYVAISSVTIPAGSKSATASIAINSDTVEDKDETFTVGFGTLPSGYHLVGLPTTVTVTDVVPSTPAVSITAGSGVTEGGSASFTLTASPKPSSALSVQVKITESGSYAASGQIGTRTVTVPTSGTASFTVSTSDDSVDEPNGSVTATVIAANGYTVGIASGTVAVSDNDIPPQVSVQAGSAVTEGDAASFTLSAFPLPSSALSVQVKITQSGSYAASGQTGTRTVTVPTSGTASFTVSTDDDSVDEADGSITATVMSGSGYGLPPAPSGTVAVSDNDVTQTTTTDEDTDDDNATTACVTPSDWSRWSWLRTKRTQPKASQSVRGLAERAVKTLEGRDTLTWSAWIAAEPGWGLLNANDSRHDNRRALRDELNRLETCRDNEGTDTPPTVSVSAGAAVTEGGSAQFTLTASPAPTAALSVKVKITQSGSFAAAGQIRTRTVTVPASGTASFTVPTADDSTDEPNGSITATVIDAAGYTVGSPSSGAVTVNDNDNPPQPEQDPESESESEPEAEAPTEFIAEVAADGTVKVGWPSQELYGTAAEGYRIRTMSYANGIRRHYDADTDQNWLTISDLPAGATYLVWIEAQFRFNGWVRALPRQFGSYITFTVPS